MNIPVGGRANSLKTNSPRGVRKGNNINTLQQSHKQTPQSNNYLNTHGRSNSGFGGIGLQSKNESNESYSNTNKARQPQPINNQYKSNYQYPK